MTLLNIVHTESSLGWGGQEIRILSEAAGLQERGHRVRLLCPRGARIFDEASRFDVPVEAVPVGRKNLRGLTSMTSWIRSQKGPASRVIFNTHSSTDSWLVALSLQGLGRPFPIVRTRHISARVPKNWPTRWLYSSAAARVVTTGQALRQQLIDDLGISPGLVESVPTGIETTRYIPGDRAAARSKLGLPTDKMLVGIVATLRSWKGHRYLIEALARMPDRIGLVIVGDGPQREALEGLVASQGMADRTRMTGNQVDVLPWLQAMDVFALPSYANEGVPQALIQAMLVGLPCVTTTAGSIGELARHEETALVVPGEDAAALRAAIGRLVADAALRERLGNAARALCQAHHSRTQMLDRMESIFATVAGNAWK